MPLHGIRAHYEQLSEFERGRIIGLKEAGWANRRIALYMGGRDAAIRRCWPELGGRLRRLPKNVEDLSRQLKPICQEILQETIRAIYHSIPRLVAACIQARVSPCTTKNPLCRATEVRYICRGSKSSQWRDVMRDKGFKHPELHLTPINNQETQ
ncbi:hypothetical protein TNCV_4510551 [Trichonephila clavipes]|nr:hypothetical protein TNCV_4510551 [Trichonephila clavipes]